MVCGKSPQESLVEGPPTPPGSHLLTVTLGSGSESLSIWSPSLEERVTHPETLGVQRSHMSRM